MQELRSDQRGSQGLAGKPSPGGYRISPGWLTFLVGLVALLIAGLAYQQSLIASGRLAGADASSANPAAATAAAPAALYTCPMHPQVIQDHPGTCPICGMELVPKDTDSSGSDDTGLMDAVKGVHLSPTQEVMANVTPVQPQRDSMALTVPAVGEVTVPQDQMREITAWQDGRIDNLMLGETGRVVRKGEHIMDLYSEELVQAQQEYLLALDAADQLGDSGYASIASSTRSLVDAGRQKLLRMGMTADQLSQLEQTRKAQDSVPIYAKEGGVVMDKSVAEGMYVMRGEKLFTVADLNPVWVEVKLFEKDAANVRTGDRVHLKSAAYPGKVFSGRVELIEPELDMETRTFKLRVKVENPGLLLKPGMFLDASLVFDYGSMLLLPRNAVLHTGDGDLVYVQAASGVWQPRRVTIGRDFGDRVEIVSGIKPGETVAGTAAFLLDSEAQLKGVPRPTDDGAGGG